MRIAVKRWKQHSVLPGFGLTLGYTVAYLGLIVLIPLAALFCRAWAMPWERFWHVVTEPRVLASYRLTFGASLIAAGINAVIGSIIAWSLVRYRFPGRKLMDALIDLPFALPTAVSGIALTAVYAQNGWIGSYLAPWGIQAAFSRLGVVLALTFIGLPFVVRTLQPAIEDLDAFDEEAAASLGANRWQTFRRVITPAHHARSADRLCTGFCPCVGGIRQCGVHLGEHADEDRDHITADHYEARAIRLCGSDGDRDGHACSFLPAATGRQRLAVVGAAREEPERDGRMNTQRLSSVRNGQSPTATVDPDWLRYLLIGTTCLLIGLLLALPLSIVFAEAFRHGMRAYYDSFCDAAAWQAIKLTLICTAISLPLNTLFGLAAAWAIAKFEFRGKSLLITLIDLPFAVSPVISGLVFVLLFGLHGWLGHWLSAHDLKIIFALPGIVLATVFVTFPFVVRELIPLMQEQGSDEEQAAVSLGARGWQTFWRVTIPNIKWALLYGVILCNARAMGEFGAVSVVSGHIRGKTNTIPLHMEILYNEYNVAAAFAMASLLALLGVVTLAAKSYLEWKVQRQLREPFESTSRKG